MAAADSFDGLFAEWDVQPSTSATFLEEEKLKKRQSATDPINEHNEEPKQKYARRDTEEASDQLESNGTSVPACESDNIDDESDDDIKEWLLELQSDQRTISHMADDKQETRSITTETSIATDFDDLKPDDYLYCDDCQEWIVDMCPSHSRVTIDAEASTINDDLPPLPEGLRYGDNAKGVFAIKEFPKGTIFGPLEAPVDERESCVSIRDLSYLWEVRLYNGRSRYLLNKPLAVGCNWPMRVNFTDNKHEQSLIAVQFKQDVYYKSIRQIMPDTELLVAHGSGLPLTKEISYNTLIARSLKAFPVQCNECFFRLTKVEKLDEHKRSSRHIFEPDKRCTRCAFIAINERALSLHYSRIHNQRSANFNCDECGKSFTHKHHLVRHKERSHSDDVRCEHCSKCYRTQAALAVHCEREHQFKIMEKTIECPICMLKFFAYEQMANHRLLAHRDKYAEKARDRIKATMKALKENKANADGMPPPPPRQISDKPKTFQCRFCEMSYVKPQSRSRHEHKKHPEQAQEQKVKDDLIELRAIECELCDKRFTSHSRLREHRALKHKLEQKYSCPHEGCGAAFLYNSLLNRHIKTKHSTERDFVCDYDGCTKSFLFKSQLVDHIKKKHDNLFQNNQFDDY